MIFWYFPESGFTFVAPGWLPLVAKTTSISLTNSEYGFGFYMKAAVEKELLNHSCQKLWPRRTGFVLGRTIRMDSQEKNWIACESLRGSLDRPLGSDAKRLAFAVLAEPDVPGTVVGVGDFLYVFSWLGIMPRDSWKRSGLYTHRLVKLWFRAAGRTAKGLVIRRRCWNERGLECWDVPAC